MRTIKHSHRFKRDYRREKSGIGKRLDAILREPLERLSSTRRCRRAASIIRWRGEWKDYRDCHIRPDLILIYRKLNDEILELVPRLS
jgi:mRNA interferase YafQ